MFYMEMSKLLIFCSNNKNSNKKQTVSDGEKYSLVKIKIKKYVNQS